MNARMHVTAASRRMVPLALAWLVVYASVAAAQSSAQPKPSRPATPINVTLPDTMKVSLPGPVRVNASAREPLIVELAGVKMPGQPWWESNWASAVLSALVVILAVFVAQRLKDAADDRRAKARLLTRMRGALETAVVTLRAVLRVKADGTREFDPQMMNDLVVEWHRYDRVSDDIGLLKNPEVAEVVDGILVATRQVAAVALEDERRFKDESDDYLRRGAAIPQQLLDRHADQRKVRLQLMQHVHDSAQRALEFVNARWKPAPWHRPRKAADEATGPETTPPRPTEGTSGRATNG